MGSLYKRTRKMPDGTTRTPPTWWIKYYQHGRPVRESTGMTKETVARRILRDREGDVEKGISINPKVGRVTFDEAAEDFLNDYRINGRKTTQNAQYRIETHLAPYFRGKRLASITTSDVRAFVAARLHDTIVVRQAR